MKKIILIIAVILLLAMNVHAVCPDPEDDFFNVLVGDPGADHSTFTESSNGEKTIDISTEESSKFSLSVENCTNPLLPTNSFEIFFIVDASGSLGTEIYSLTSQLDALVTDYIKSEEDGGKDLCLKAGLPLDSCVSFGMSVISGKFGILDEEGNCNPSSGENRRAAGQDPKPSPATNPIDFFQLPGPESSYNYCDYILQYCSSPNPSPPPSCLVPLTYPIVGCDLCNVPKMNGTDFVNALDDICAISWQSSAPSCGTEPWMERVGFVLRDLGENGLDWKTGETKIIIILTDVFSNYEYNSYPYGNAFADAVNRANPAENPNEIRIFGIYCDQSPNGVQWGCFQSKGATTNFPNCIQTCANTYPWNPLGFQNCVATSCCNAAFPNCANDIKDCCICDSPQAHYCADDPTHNPHTIVDLANDTGGKAFPFVTLSEVEAGGLRENVESAIKISFSSDNYVIEVVDEPGFEVDWANLYFKEDLEEVQRYNEETGEDYWKDGDILIKPTQAITGTKQIKFFVYPKGRQDLGKYTVVNFSSDDFAKVLDLTTSKEILRPTESFTATATIQNLTSETINATVKFYVKKLDGDSTSVPTVTLNNQTIAAGTQPTVISSSPISVQGLNERENYRVLVEVSGITDEVVISNNSKSKTIGILEEKQQPVAVPEIHPIMILGLFLVVIYLVFRK